MLEEMKIRNLATHPQAEGGMRRVLWWVVLGSVAGLQSVAPLVGFEDQAVDVALGVDTTTPGGQAYVPLTLSLRGGLAVSKILSEVSFPKNVLSFVEAKRGAAGEQVQAEIATEVREDKEPGTSIVKVTVTAKQELPEGVLVNLSFQVSSHAKEGAIRLTNLAKAIAGGGEEIQCARSQDGEVTITRSPVPLAGCFFYVH